ncbi:MAG TPA: hypothetical protein PKL63_01060, partial [Dermatophilaceae bacterium]|nr:hypothetical protein [Dermatophilaceae bacterium]
MADAVAEAAAYLGGMPATPVPLERTDRAPWVWASAQALRSRVNAHGLADAVREHPAVEAVTVRADGWLEITLASEWVDRTLADLAAPAGMPPAHLPAAPPAVLGRRTLDNPGFVVLLAHARACRVAGQALAGPERAGQATDQDDAGAFHPQALRDLSDPLDVVLLTEILDAPRRLVATAPHQCAAALLAVAAAYLPWEERCPAIATRPGEPS